MTKTLLSLVMASLAASTPALAQQETPVGYKDPGTSMLLSVVVPGGGQMYSGETGKGAALLGVGLGGLALGVAATSSSVGVSCDEDDFRCEDDTNYLPMALGYVAYLGSWIYGIIDADDSAKRMNARRGLTAGVTPVVAPTRHGGAEVGLSVRF